MPTPYFKDSAGGQQQGPQNLKAVWASLSLLEGLMPTSIVHIKKGQIEHWHIQIWTETPDQNICHFFTNLLNHNDSAAENAVKIGLNVALTSFSDPRDNYMGFQFLPHCNVCYIPMLKSYLQSKKFDEFVQVLPVLGAEISVHCIWKSRTEQSKGIRALIFNFSS